MKIEQMGAGWCGGQGVSKGKEIRVWKENIEEKKIDT